MAISPVVITTLLGVIVAALLWIGWLLLSRRGESNRPDRIETAVELLKAELITKQAESLAALHDSLGTANKIMNERLAEGTSSLDRRLSVLGNIENRLGQLGVQADNIEAVGKNIQSLSELLRAPKLRGNIGELLLDNILSQILPQATYETQYTFADGRRVDAVIKLHDRLLPIDSKFPLEAFERLRSEPDSDELQKHFTRAFKKHVDDIAEKYIQPAEKTTEFAIMYVPAEAVYYQLISQADQEIFNYAMSRRVVPSSPGHLYAFLSSIVTLLAQVSLSGESLSEDSRRMISGLSELVETAERIEQVHTRLQGSLRAMTTGLDRARIELDKSRSLLDKLREPFRASAE